jgi:hypothetical protein
MESVLYSKQVNMSSYIYIGTPALIDLEQDLRKDHFPNTLSEMT